MHTLLVPFCNLINTNKLLLHTRVPGRCPQAQKPRNLNKHKQSYDEKRKVRAYFSSNQKYVSTYKEKKKKKEVST